MKGWPPLNEQRRYSALDRCAALHGFSQERTLFSRSATMRSVIR